jgi:hypothetical protein
VTGAGGCTNVARCCDRFFSPLPIDPHDGPLRRRDADSWHVHQGSIRRHHKLSGGDKGPCLPPHAVDQRHGSAPGPQGGRLEWYGQHSVAQRVDEVSCGQIAAVGAPADERLPYSAVQRLDDNLCLVPTRGLSERE